MIVCPVCGKQNFSSFNCPSCEADLTPLQRLHEWPHAALYVALQQIENNQLEQAESILVQIVALIPDFMQANYLLAKLAEQRGDFERAVYFYERAISPETDEKYHAEYKDCVAKLQSHKENMVPRIKYHAVKRWVGVLLLLSTLLVVFALIIGSRWISASSSAKKLAENRHALKDIAAQFNASNGSHIDVVLQPGAVTLYGIVNSKYEKEKLINEIAHVITLSDFTCDDRIVITTKADKRIEYVVKNGDTLSKIASYFYADADAWKKVYIDNRAELADPHQLTPGKKLYINFDE